MNRQTLILFAVALVSMLAGAALFHWFDSAPEESEVKLEAATRLHAIPLTDLQGRESQIGDWQGDILIVNFWAPWCLPCRREVPTLIEFQQQHAQQGVRVLGIALDGEKQVSGFADEYGINYPLYLAGNRITMYNAAFGNPSGSLPFTAILDRELGIRFQHNGEVTRTQLQQQLDALL